MESVDGVLVGVGSLCLLPTNHFPKPAMQAKASIRRHQKIGIPKYGKDEK
jgi:hypothetical protein